MRPNLSILIAEDDPDDQFLLEMALKQVCPPGVQFEFVSDGVELLERLHDNTGAEIPWNVLVLDLNMPRKDGREALKAIKKDARWSSLPVVILTTSTRPEDMDDCKKMGAADFYQKPGTLAELEQILLKICDAFLNPGNES